MSTQIGTSASELIYREFYVYDEIVVSTDRFECIIEESKAQYKIHVSTNNLFVDADLSSGANKNRAKTIKQYLKKHLNIQ